MLHTATFRVPTAKPVDVIDVTVPIAEAVELSGIQAGLATVILKHTSAAICIQENETNLIQDFEEFLHAWLKDDPEEPRYNHNQLWKRPDVPANEPRNAAAHLKSLLIGNSCVIPIKNGKLDLGQWQRVLLLEMDGPREREVNVMTMGDAGPAKIQEYWSERSEVINAAIEPYLNTAFVGDALKTSRYITKGGKRIRGVLTLLTCEALGGDMDRAMDAAVAVEILHAASLAKDDVQDGDKKRRGGPSAWVVYGIRNATSMADVMVPHAISMTKKYGKEAVYAVVEAWREIGMGQMKDLLLGSFKSGRVYEEIAKGKTAALFAMATTLGAIAANAPKAERKRAADYGRKIGYLFQAVDDYADIEAGLQPPDSFRAWAGDDPKEHIEGMMTQIEMIADEFPDTPQREVLIGMPRFAYNAMVLEARAMKKASSRKKAKKENGGTANAGPRAPKRRPRKTPAV